MEKFTFRSKYDEYHDCWFEVGYYENGNLAVEIWNNEYEVISRSTVNPDIRIHHTQIAIKDYSENEGMVDFFKGMDLIEDSPVRSIPSGWITIPVYNLTEKGKIAFGIQD